MRFLSAFFITITVLFFGIYPALVAMLPDGAVDTLTFLAAAYSVAMLANVINLTAARGLLSNAPRWRAILGAIPVRSVILAALDASFNMLSFACLYYAIRHGAVFEASILYELYATFYLIATILNRSARANENQRFETSHSPMTSAAFFVVGAIGITVLAASAHLPESAHSSVEWHQLFQFEFASITTATTFGAPIFMAMSYWFHVLNGQALRRALVKARDGAVPDGAADIAERTLGAIVAALMSRTSSVVMIAAIALMLGQTGQIARAILAFQNDTLLLLLSCGLIMGFAGVCSSLANNFAKSSNINLLLYFEPFVATLCLLAFGFSSQATVWTFFGAILVLAANFVLTTRLPMSIAFRCTILAICGASAAVFLPAPSKTAPEIELAATLIGLFGLLAAFLIERLYRDDRRIETPEAFRDYLLRHGNSLFVQWVMAIGIVILLVGFRDASSIQYDFFAVVMTAAVTYIALMPLDIIRPTPVKGDAPSPVWSLPISATFIVTLLVLLLVGLNLR